jgi:hypothetical protein
MLKLHLENLNIPSEISGNAQDILPQSIGSSGRKNCLTILN